MLKEYIPIIRANAIAAAIFGAVLAILYPVMIRFPSTWQTPAFLALAFGYVLVMNRFLARMVKPPESVVKRRKGSFKQEKGRGWTVARWALSVTIIGMVVQVAVFMTVYAVLRTALGEVGL